MNDKNELDYELLSIAPITYGFVLKQTREANEEKGRLWRQKDIAKKAKIGERTLQKYEAGEILPPADVRNMLAIALEDGLLRSAPPEIETAASLEKRFEAEMRAVERFAKNRSDVERKEIEAWEIEYKKAVARRDSFVASEIDWKLHRTYANYHPDSWVRDELIWRMKTRIAYIAEWGTRLGILEGQDRDSYASVHRHLLHVSHAGSADDILKWMRSHFDYSLKGAERLEKFYDKNRTSRESR